jgi:hypothetical protein
MNTARELRTHPRGRTGVRFVLTDATDPGRADEYGAWYDDYENAIIRPGLLANAFRFETRTRVVPRPTHATPRSTTS